ncbi:MAG: glycosyltransferase family 4 protein [Anaerolineae bacterium]|jgi:glycosyltransferase involved in cell wall biosynthesis|nr:glycosyltransferase family 4 protein [Anaerolineae bacterium]
MKIGLIAADLSHKHGWAHYSLELAQALHKAGVELTILASHNSPPHADLPQNRILPSLVPRETAILPKLALQMGKSRHCLQDCDLIHTCVEPFAPLAAWIGGKRPLIQAGVGSYLRVDHWQRPPLTTLYRQAIARSQIVAISHFTANVAREAFPHTSIYVVPLGINADRFAHLPTLPKHGNTVLTVGGIKERKGTLELVQAIAEVRKSLPEIQCIVIGNPAEGSDYTRQVRAVIHDHQLEDCVQILGFVPEATLLHWYAQADLFVLPSMNRGWMFEGYGLVHMEASAAGLPVIGTRNCGIEDAIDHEITGLLVSQADVAHELPAAILALLRDPVKRAHMGAAGRLRAQTHTWDRVAHDLIAIYTQALAGRS